MQHQNIRWSILFPDSPKSTVKKNLWTFLDLNILFKVGSKWDVMIMFNVNDTDTFALLFSSLTFNPAYYNKMSSSTIVDKFTRYLLTKSQQ